MVHSQTCSNPAAFQNLSCSCMMILCWEVGFGGGGREGVFRGWPWRDRMWVPTQEMRYSATSACVQAGPSLWFAGGKRYLMNQNWSQSKVWVGSGGPQSCITSASPERTAQRQSSPRPNPHRRCRAISYMCRHVKLGIWGCVRELVCTVRAIHSVFPTFPSTHCTNFGSKGPSE